MWSMMNAKFSGGDIALYQRDSLLYSDERMGLLDNVDREVMEAFILKKLDYSKERILDDWNAQWLLDQLCFLATDKAATAL